MAYTFQIGNDFWFDFDDQFLHHRTAQATQAILGLYPQGDIDLLLRLWTTDYGLGGSAIDFKSASVARANALRRLADLQQAVFAAHLPSVDDELSAFIDFGQGTLFDERRSPGLRIHMMDVNSGGGGQIGYHRWFTFALACHLADIDAGVWDLRIRHLAVALKLHIVANPMQDLPGQTTGNPALPPETVEEIKNQWLNADLEAINAFFLQTNPLA